MKTTAKPTPGPCAFPTDLASHINDSQGRYIVDVPMPNWMSFEEWTANKALVAEAFNVHHETGLSPRELLAQRDELLEALKEGRRAIGDHITPTDCYATGPSTGDHFRDLAQCPACSFIATHDAAIAAIQNASMKGEGLKPGPVHAIKTTLKESDTPA